MRVLKKGNRNTNRLAYTSLVHPVLGSGSALLGTMQRNTLDRVQKKAAQFTNHTKDFDWETLAQRRTVLRLCALLGRTLGNGLGKLYATGCEGLTI